MKHPIGMYVISATEMWERFSFYIFSGILVLFMLEVLHFSVPFCTFLYGIIIGLTYFLQLVAGFVCDAYLGNRKSVIIGGILMIIAQLVFTYCGSLFYLTANVAEHSSFLFSYPEIVFLIGVVVMAVGASLFKVSITSFVGLFYDENDERLDSAYTIFYMLINAGAFFAPLLLNFVVGVNNPSLYQYGFLVGAIIITIGVVMFLLLKNKYVCLPNGEPVGIIPVSKTQKNIEKRKNVNIDDKLSKIEIDHLKVIVLILLVITVFFIAHEQISTSIIILSMDYVNNIIPVINYEIFPEFYLSLNPLFIVIFSLVFIKLMSLLSDRKKEPSSISKLTIGLIFLAISFLFLYVPFLLENTKIEMVWMLLFNFFLVISEIFIMPISLSLITKLSPLKYKTSMVGILFVATGIAEVFSGMFASALPSGGETTMLLGIIPISNIASFMGVFIILAVVALIIWVLLKGKIKKLMHDVN
ncbi:peptide MFS transporter [uncultured Methanobrevibacter sp.]|uniref:peptide MFS transporter n=1 Tax=uncultured Methanobrevibacter sp. TaxID=253161 RepID=UPI0025E59D7C|nr:peptide MFS transporter [uncultured Methanobrevibacter sp.]